MAQDGFYIPDKNVPQLTVNVFVHLAAMLDVLGELIIEIQSGQSGSSREDVQKYFSDRLERAQVERFASLYQKFGGIPPESGT
jgi:hypothetical protein